MLRRVLLSSAFGLVLGLGSMSAAEVFVRIAPPVAVVETPGPRPGPGHVWIAGYHRWEGGAYVWTPGRWEVPPRARARWVPHHWARRRGGWVFVEGHWR